MVTELPRYQIVRNDYLFPPRTQVTSHCLPLLTIPRYTVSGDNSDGESAYSSPTVLKWYLHNHTFVGHGALPRGSKHATPRLPTRVKTQEEVNTHVHIYVQICTSYALCALD